MCRVINFASTAKICLFVHWKELNEFMFVPLDCTHRTLLLKQGVCLLQQRLQLASPEIKKKKMLIMQRRNHWNELFFAAFTWNSRERFWHGNFPLFSRPFIGGYQNFTVPPSPSHPMFVAKIEEVYKYALYVAVVPSCQMILHSLTCERRQFRLLRQCSALLWKPAAQMMLRWAEGKGDKKRK